MSLEFHSLVTGYSHFGNRGSQNRGPCPLCERPYVSDTCHDCGWHPAQDRVERIRVGTGVWGRLKRLATGVCDRSDAQSAQEIVAAKQTAGSPTLSTDCAPLC